MCRLCHIPDINRKTTTIWTKPKLNIFALGWNISRRLWTWCFWASFSIRFFLNSLIPFFPFRFVWWTIILSWAGCCQFVSGTTFWDYILLEYFSFIGFGHREKPEAWKCIFHNPNSDEFDLVIISHLFLFFCSNNKMKYSFEMEILCTQAKQRWNDGSEHIFVYAHLRWEKSDLIFSRDVMMTYAKL